MVLASDLEVVCNQVDWTSRNHSMRSALRRIAKHTAATGLNLGLAAPANRVGSATVATGWCGLLLTNVPVLPLPLAAHVHVMLLHLLTLVGRLLHVLMLLLGHLMLVASLVPASLVAILGLVTLCTAGLVASILPRTRVGLSSVVTVVGWFLLHKRF